MDTGGGHQRAGLFWKVHGHRTRSVGPAGRRGHRHQLITRPEGVGGLGSAGDASLPHHSRAM